MTQTAPAAPAVLPAAGAALIQVNPPLKCGMENCHNLATAAWADPILLGPTSGSYYLIPICRACAAAALNQYGPVEEQQPDPLVAIYQDDDFPAWKSYLLSLELDELEEAA